MKRVVFYGAPWRPCLLFMILLTAILLPVYGEEPPPTEEELKAAVKNLAAAHFKERQLAAEVLWRGGEAAREILTQASQSDDPEVRAAALDILNKINSGLLPDTE